MNNPFSFKIYDFTLQANGVQTLPAMGSYFRIMSSTGSLEVTVEGRGTATGLQAGQGFKDQPFTKLLLRDTSGAPNSGFILAASSEFFDNRLNGTFDLTPATLAALESVDLNTATLNAQRAVESTGRWNNTAALTANTPLQVLAPGANTTGVDLLDAGYIQVGNGMTRVAIFFLLKASAPSTFADGEVVCGPDSIGNDASSFLGTGKLRMPVYVPPGLGIYAISQEAQPATSAGFPAMRYARWRAR